MTTKPIIADAFAHLYVVELRQDHTDKKAFSAVTFADYDDAVEYGAVQHDTEGYDVTLWRDDKFVSSLDWLPRGRELAAKR
jgi:hypothetical protein